MMGLIRTSIPAGGVRRGERIVPEGWVQCTTTTPSAAAPRGEYGAHTWHNAGSAADPNDRRWPAAPQDAFAALGFQEQKVIVIPSKKTGAGPLRCHRRQDSMEYGRIYGKYPGVSAFLTG